MDNFGFNGNVNNYNSGLTYLGAWDALNNIPNLTSGVGTGGGYYIVSIAGTTNLDGITDWQVGDWAIFESATNMWQKIDNHDVQAYNTIQNQSVNLPQRSIIDFQGTGVVASDNGVKTIVSIAAPTTYGLYAQTSDSASVTGIAKQSIIGSGVGTLTVPANSFKVGDSFTAELDGLLSCLGSATLHIHVETLTGVVLADTGIIAMDVTTSKSWLLNLYFTIRTIGGTTIASISSGGLFSYIKNAGSNFEGYVLSNINNTTFDTTISNTLVVFAQWNTANASNQILSRNFTLQKIY
jgi:hypothetical protein